MTEHNLVIAKKDRAIIRSSIDKYIENIKNYIQDSNPDYSELELMLEQLNQSAVELKIVDSEVKKLVKDSQLDSEIQSSEEYREKIITWRFKANKKLKEQNETTEIRTSDSFSSQSKSETNFVKLPKLEISKFSGNRSEWLTFWSSFENAIHENKNLNPVEKFNYLKSYLSDSVRKYIEGFAMTSENYFKCIKLLIDRYGKKEYLIDTHINILLSISPVKSSNDIAALRNLYDKILIQTRSLESLDINISTYGNLLAPIILKLLPKDLVLEFNKQTNKSYCVEEILNFLLNQLNARERTQQSIDESSKDFSREKRNVSFHRTFPPSLPDHRHPDARKLFSSTELFVDCETENDKRKKKCAFCTGIHDSNKCLNVKHLSFPQKLVILRQKGICYRCLGYRHVGKNCSSSILCRNCNGPHSDIMCNRQRKEKNEGQAESSNESQLMLSNRNKSSNVYLQTLIAQIRGENGSALIRLIIDTGSENSYVSKYVANQLNLKRVKTENVKHGLFGGIQLSEKHDVYKFTLSSLDKSFSYHMEAFDMHKICAGINHVSDRKLIQSLEEENVFLSDIYGKRDLCLFENNPEEIHLLIGADVAAHLFTQNIRYLPNIGLSAFQTKLGWVIMGKAKQSRISPSEKTNNSLSNLSLSLHVSNCNVSDLWRLDILGILNEENRSKTDLEEDTQRYFLETVKRDTSGRFEVCLPWIVDPSILPSNKSIAENAVHKIDKKLIASKNKKEYTNIFNSWNSNKIIEEVTYEKKDRVHYLPHRPIIKDSSETTKIRPVFNASAHMKNSPSLNDCLTKGPNLIEIIPHILNRFRKYAIGISSDIEKAFLQISITEKDRDFLRFFWLDEENNMKVYRHCRVVFGLTSSPFLLVATLKHLLNQVPPHLEETARVLATSFYLDNSLISLNSKQETDKFVKDSVSILALGHFNLRCWRSNVPISTTEDAKGEIKVTPVLGLNWDLTNDSLTCKIDEKLKIEDPITKRKILSIVQKIFDPIGFTTPVTLHPKLILQKTWIEKLNWDEELPQNLRNQFNNWLRGISLLPEIEIPRWLNLEIKNEHKATLHVFSDASKLAYATCAFIRVETQKGVKIQLVNSRSRVSPIKELTIPRLELLSCLIGARIAKTISSDLEIPNIKTVFWSDSITALCWIRREQSWGTYVHNRVSEIRKLSNVSDWRHVPGILNPADLPSRGCSFEQLKRSRWWEGPSWLYLPEDTWPQAEDPPDEELVNKEKKKTVLTLLDQNSSKNWYYYYFSSYRKIIRMIAWVQRFIYNLRHKEKILASNISVEEFENAEKTVFKLIQKESFAGRTDPKIRSLRPQEDENQMLKVKTNVINRTDTENFRFPIILPYKHPVVERLIFEKHVENKHAGVGILMAILRENYWIVKSRKFIRNVVRKCTTCKRFETSRTDVEPGVPPEDRVRDAAIFEVVGTDLAGPLYLSDGSKGWVVLYTCAIYRAIHLELISSLSTESFLQSLRRFIARRGRPHVIYSDNATNYVGTANALSNLDWDKIRAEASIQKIRWKFNPPAAPWWGGWWERLVRSVKEILRKILGRASLNYEELNTVLCDCEEVINSRPITYVSEDNSDLSPLTPKMFLQELSSSGIPDLDALDNKAFSRRARYKQRIRDDLRKRFRSEYLGQLRQHFNKKNKFQRLQVGDIVLLEDTSGKRIHWPLAKIIQLYPGKDGITRLARIKTQTGTFLRPLQRLFPLEVCASSTSVEKLVRQPKEISNEKDIPSTDCATAAPVGPTPPVDPTPPVVTKSGRVIKTPLRFQP